VFATPSWRATLFMIKFSQTLASGGIDLCSDCCYSWHRHDSTTMRYSSEDSLGKEGRSNWANDHCISAILSSNHFRECLPNYSCKHYNIRAFREATRASRFSHCQCGSYSNSRTGIEQRTTNCFSGIQRRYRQYFLLRPCRLLPSLCGFILHRAEVGEITATRRP